MQENQLKEAMEQAVGHARATTPLAGSITNDVTIDFVANAQLAAGGSAAMVRLADEGECLVAAGESVYLNIGTLLPLHGESIPHTAAVAHAAGKPWVLDPVGIGIGELRSAILRDLKPSKPTVIRGNASEIIALASLWELAAEGDAQRPRGVDSVDEVDAALSAAAALARYTGGAVAVSGATDLVTDGTVAVYSRGGSALMSKVTGFGCSLGGVIAVYAAVADPLTAAVTGVAHYNLAGTRADQRADAPASFKVAFIDELYRATAHDIATNPLEIKEL